MFDPELKVVCCFCGEGTVVRRAVEIVLPEWSQQFFAHRTCLRERLHPDMPHMLDDE